MGIVGRGNVLKSTAKCLTFDLTLNIVPTSKEKARVFSSFPLFVAGAS